MILDVEGFPWFETHLFFTSLIGGLLFGTYVYLMGDDESSWHDIVGWGLAVYFFFLFLNGIHRLLEGNPEGLRLMWVPAMRWFTFIFTIVLTAGTMRFVRNQVRRYRDRLPQ